MSEKSSNPSEELNDHPAPNFSQGKVGTFLDYDSSNTQARKTFVVQSPSHSIEKPDQQQCRRDKHELEHSIYKGFPSEQSLVANGKEEDDQRCRRDGKQWHCSQMVSPGNQYCQKHQLYMVARNERRRKGPSRGQSFVVDDPRCRRNGKGWRCHEMVVLGKIYCEKHVLAQSILNAKRRKGAPRGQHFWVDDPQCGHTEESHRCSQMRLHGNIYCVKHQLEQSINNERSRTRQREESSLVAGDHSTGLKKKKVNNKGMETDQEKLSQVSSIAIESSTKQRKTKKLTTRRSTMTSSPCKKLQTGQAIEGCLSPEADPDITVHTRTMTGSEIFSYVSTKGEKAPLQKKEDKNQISTNVYSSPSEGLSDPPTPSFGQEKNRSLFDCKEYGYSLIATDSSMSPLSGVREREKCCSSNNQLQCSQKTVAFRCPPLSISGPSADKEEVGKHKTTTLGRTVGQSEELVSGKSAEGLEHEATCIEITDAMQIECIVEETEIRVKETCNKSENMQPLSMLLEDSSPTRMNIRISRDNLLTSCSDPICDGRWYGG